MTKAIEAKWLPWTNTKPRRVVAFAEGGNRHLQSASCDDLTDLQQEAAAAYALASRLSWAGVWIAGTLPNGNTAFVNVGRSAGQLEALTAYLAGLPLGSWFEIVGEGGHAPCSGLSFQPTTPRLMTATGWRRRPAFFGRLPTRWSVATRLEAVRSGTLTETAWGIGK